MPSSGTANTAYATAEQLRRIAPVTKGWDQPLEALVRAIVSAKEQAEINPCIYDVLKCESKALMGWQSALHEAEIKMSSWSVDERLVLIALLQLIPSLGRKKLMFFGRALGRNQVIATILSAGFGKRFDRKKISSATETMKKRVADRVYERLKGDGDRQSQIHAAKGRCLLGRHDRFAGPSEDPWGDDPASKAQMKADLDNRVNEAWPSAGALHFPWPEWVHKFMRVDSVENNVFPDQWPQWLRDIVNEGLNATETDEGDNSGGDGNNGKPKAKRPRPHDADGPHRPPKGPRPLRKKGAAVQPVKAREADTDRRVISPAEAESVEALFQLHSSGSSRPSTEGHCSQESTATVDADTSASSPELSFSTTGTGSDVASQTHSAGSSMQLSDGSTTGHRVMSVNNILQYGIAGPLPACMTQSVPPAAQPEPMLSAEHLVGHTQQLDPAPAHEPPVGENGQANIKLAKCFDRSGSSSNAPHHSQHCSSAYHGRGCRCLTCISPVSDGPQVQPTAPGYPCAH